MADIDADLVVLAGAVTVTQESDLFSVGDDAFDLNADLMFGTFLLLIVQGVINHFFVETCRGLKCTTLAKTERHICLINYY